MNNEFKININEINFFKKENWKNFKKDYKFYIFYRDNKEYEYKRIPSSKMVRYIEQKHKENCDIKNEFHLCLKIPYINTDKGAIYMIKKEQEKFFLDKADEYLKSKEINYSFNKIDISELVELNGFNDYLLNLLLINMYYDLIPKVDIITYPFKNENIVLEKVFLIPNLKHKENGYNFYNVSNEIDNDYPELLEIIEVSFSNNGINVLMDLTTTFLYSDKYLEKEKNSKKRDLKIEEEEIISSGGYYPIDLLKMYSMSGREIDSHLAKNYYAIANVEEDGLYYFKHRKIIDKKPKYVAVKFDKNSVIQWDSRAHLYHLIITNFNKYYNDVCEIKLVEENVLKPFKNEVIKKGKNYSNPSMKDYLDEKNENKLKQYEKAKEFLLNSGTVGISYKEWKEEWIKDDKTIESKKEKVVKIVDVIEKEFNSSAFLKDKEGDFNISFIISNDKQNVTNKTLNSQHLDPYSVKFDKYGKTPAAIRKVIMELAIKSSISLNKLPETFSFNKNHIFVYISIIKKGENDFDREYVIFEKSEEADFRIRFVTRDELLELSNGAIFIDENKSTKKYCIIDKEKQSVIEIKRTNIITLPKEFIDIDNFEGWRRDYLSKTNSFSSFVGLSYGYDTNNLDHIFYYIGDFGDNLNEKITNFPHKYVVDFGNTIEEEDVNNFIEWYFPMLENNFIHILGASIYPWPFKWIMEWIRGNSE